MNTTTQTSPTPLLTRTHAAVVDALTRSFPAATVRPGNVGDDIASVIVLPGTGNAVHVAIDTVAPDGLVGLEVSRGGAAAWDGHRPTVIPRAAVNAVRELIAA